MVKTNITEFPKNKNSLIGNIKRFRWYFILAVIFALWKGAAHFLVNVPFIRILVLPLLLPLALIWLIISIIVLVKFSKNKFGAVYLVLPIYYILGFVLDIVLGGIVEATAQPGGNGNPLWDTVILTSRVVFEILYSIYMLKTKL